MVQNFQQPLDITVCEGEPVFFKVTGSHTVYLTGNYVIGLDEGHPDMDDDEVDEDDYDLSPDEDELDMDEIMARDEESDDLDDMEDPRITEIDSDEEVEAPKLVVAKGKGKNKRAADSDEEPGLDDMMAKGKAAKAAKAEEPTLSKSQQKKLKKNNGDAAAVEQKKDAKADKKVQFAKNLEQGPTPSGDKPTGTLGVKEVKGVKIDDKKLGKGAAAKNGNTIAMRYIGKLEDGKVFDCM